MEEELELEDRGNNQVQEQEERDRGESSAEELSQNHREEGGDSGYPPKRTLLTCNYCGYTTSKRRKLMTHEQHHAAHEVFQSSALMVSNAGLPAVLDHGENEGRTILQEQEDEPPSPVAGRPDLYGEDQELAELEGGYTFENPLGNGSDVNLPAVSSANPHSEYPDASSTNLYSENPETSSTNPHSAASSTNAHSEQTDASSASPHSQHPDAQVVTDLASIVMKYQLSSACVNDLLKYVIENSRERSGDLEQLPETFKSFWKRFDDVLEADASSSVSQATRSKVIDMLWEGYEEVTFHHYCPRESILKILNNPAVTVEQELLLSYDVASAQDCKLTELNSGQWWHNATLHVLKKFQDPDVKLLPIIFSADGSPISQKRSVKPIYLSLGIHRLKYRRSLQARQCIGYIPNASTVNARKRSDESVSSLVKRFISLKCWNVILELLKQDELLIWRSPSGKTYKFAPVPMFWIMDHPEAQQVCQVKWGHKVEHPCRFCVIEASKMSDLVRKNLPVRTEKKLLDTKNDIDCISNLLPDYGFHLNEETFDIRLKSPLDFPIYLSFPMDVFHIWFSQGLIKEHIDNFLTCVEKNGQPIGAEANSEEVIELTQARAPNVKSKKSKKLIELDELFQQIPRYSERDENGSLRYMNLFPKGISNLSFLTGTDYMHLLQQIPFLLANSGSRFVPETTRRMFLDVFYYLHRMAYLVFKVKTWTEETIEDYNQQLSGYSAVINSSGFKEMSKSGFNTSKNHALAHVVSFVLLFGPPGNYEASREEAAHALNVKAAFRKTNKKDDYEKNMLIWTQRWQDVKAYEARKAMNQESADIPAATGKKIRAFEYSLSTRSCKMVLPHVVKYGLKNYLQLGLKKMRESLSIHRDRYNELSRQLQDLSMVVSVSKNALLPPDNDIIVADQDYLGRGPRFDFIELNKPDVDNRRSFHRVMAIVHAMDTMFFVTKRLMYADNSTGSTGVHAQSGYIWLRYESDSKSPDGHWWDIFDVSVVLAKRCIVPDPFVKDHFFVNDMVLL